MAEAVAQHTCPRVVNAHGRLALGQGRDRVLAFLGVPRVAAAPVEDLTKPAVPAAAQAPAKADAPGNLVVWKFGGGATELCYTVAP